MCTCKFYIFYIIHHMIITLGWHHGAGKSTIWAKLGEYFGYKRYSTGDFMRALAMERWISLIDLGREAEWDGGIIDAILDDRQIKLWETEDNFIIDGRLAFHFIPKAIKVFLTVSPEEAARRIFADQTRQGVETHETIEHAVTNIEIRRQSEDDRYILWTPYLWYVILWYRYRYYRSRSWYNFWWIKK